MAHGEVRRFIHLLECSYSGPTWHGPPIRDVLEELSEETAFWKLGNSHSVLEIVVHMVRWREYVLRLLSGNHNRATDSELIFPRIESPDEYDWTDTLTLLSKSQNSLLEALRHFPEDKLEDTVPGDRDYNWHYLLYGLLQHDAYHLGQIRFLTQHYKD